LLKRIECVFKNFFEKFSIKGFQENQKSWKGCLKADHFSQVLMPTVSESVTEEGHIPHSGSVTLS